MTFQVLLSLHLLIQLVLQAVPLIFQLTQLGRHIELLPGFFLKQLLQERTHMVVPGMPPRMEVLQVSQMVQYNTHLGVLKLGSKGSHIFGQFDGFALCLIEHASDTLHFILGVGGVRDQGDETQITDQQEGPFSLRIRHTPLWDRTCGTQ